VSISDLSVGGIGFIGSGTDTSTLSQDLKSASKLIKDSDFKTESGCLPIGVGFINWGADRETAMPLIAQFRPAAVWFFAPTDLESLHVWASQVRQTSPDTKVWIQVGSVQEAIEVVNNVKPDVLVVQGTDAGGHGLVRGAGLISLLPEIHDAIRKLYHKNPFVSSPLPMPVFVAAGGIVEGRGAAAAFALGASGVVLGTRLLASPEAKISKGYQNEILRATDGGQTTVRTKVYDNLRGTTGWAHTHNGRGIINKSYTDAIEGMSEEENKTLYDTEAKKGDEGWGVNARMTTYAGTGVGLILKVRPVREIVNEVRADAKVAMQHLNTATATAKL
jgi:nitronate monooxygenase